MASSAQEHQSLPTTYGTTTTAPPPTPSTQPTSLSSSDAVDALSRLLHKLPPSLSLPPRLLPRTTTSPPTISFSPQNPNFLHPHLSSFSQLGFFQLTNHPISSQLANSAESDSVSLFKLSKTQKQQTFSKTWPLGYDDGEDTCVEEGGSESFCFDSSSSTELTESTHLSISTLHDFTHELDKIGLEIVDALSWAMGFDKALKEKGIRFSSLMWVSEGAMGNNKQSGRFYPYILSLQYQIKCTKYSLLTDSGWVSVSPQVDSVLVTVGDIAQVWSNGKLKKVRGRPVTISGDSDNSPCVTMSLLVTLPTDIAITISPLLPVTTRQDDGDVDQAAEEEKSVFDTFTFEDYAWRVYNERFLFKDPLDRHRVQSK